MSRLRPAHSKAPAQKAETVQTEISALQTLPQADLKQRWHDLFHVSVPHNLSKRLLTHALAYEIQVRAYGGLKKITRQMLADSVITTRPRRTRESCSTMTQADGTSAVADNALTAASHLNIELASYNSTAVKHQPQPSTRTRPPTITLSPGTRLMREWRGMVHVVDVVEGGFMWKGKVHRSLSAIARAITGVRWNGLAFFGLRKRNEGCSNRVDEISTDAFTDNASQPHEQAHNGNLNNHAPDVTQHSADAP